MATDSVSAHADSSSELERRILSEKAKGLSDLEVASKLLLYESTVRSIALAALAGLRRHETKHSRSTR